MRIFVHLNICIFATYIITNIQILLEKNHICFTKRGMRVTMMDEGDSFHSLDSFRGCCPMFRGLFYNTWLTRANSNSLLPHYHQYYHFFSICHICHQVSTVETACITLAKTALVLNL